MAIKKEVIEELLKDYTLYLLLNSRIPFWLTMSLKSH